MLGKIPETALEGSYDETRGGDATPLVTDEDVEEIQALIYDQLTKEKKRDFTGRSKWIVMYWPELFFLAGILYSHRLLFLCFRFQNLL